MKQETREMVMVALKGVVDSRATLRTRPTNAGAVARFEYQVTLQSVRLLLFFFSREKLLRGCTELVE